MTFAKMTEIEPRLLALLHDAEDAGTGAPWRCEVIWYGNIKRRLRQLVGWDAERPELSGTAEYETARRVVYEALCGRRNT